MRPRSTRSRGSPPPTPTIVVPVYQRQYRWDIGGCEQLLGRHPRRRATRTTAHMHFIGSILSTASSRRRDDRRARAHRRAAAHHHAHAAVAALHHTVARRRPALAAELERVLVRAGRPGPHEAPPAPSLGGGLRERRARPRGRPDDDSRESRFDDNYAFFRSQVRPTRCPRIWRGLQKLEHVSITLGAGRERPADLREPQLHGRAAARPRAHPQLRAHGPLARRAERDRGRRSGCRSSRTPASAIARVLAALPRHDAPAARSPSSASAACTTRSGRRSRAWISTRCDRHAARVAGLLGRSTASCSIRHTRAGRRDRAPARATSTRSGAACIRS